MSIGPISATGSIAGITSIGRPDAASGSGGFAEKVSGALESVSNTEKHADLLAQDVAAGGDTPVADLMIATTEATLNVEMLVQMRNKAVEAYQEIMRMQV